MTDVNRYFLTTSNFRKLVYKSHVEVGENIVEAYRQVFEGADLMPYLNHNEVKTLLKSILFLQKSEDALSILEKEGQKKFAERKRLDSPSKFLFVAGAPKYHAKSNCETLQADFENFEVPEEISSRGAGEVKSFREFALKNRKLLSEGREDVFQMRLRSQYRLTQPLGKVSAPNSGTSPWGMDNEIKIDEIVARIHKAINKIESFKESEEGNKAYEAYMYASTKILFSEGGMDSVKRQLLEAKRELIGLIVDYHVKKEMGGSVTYSEELLKLFGFEPCRVCCPVNLAF